LDLDNLARLMKDPESLPLQCRASSGAGGSDGPGYDTFSPSGAGVFGGGAAEFILVDVYGK